MNTPESAAHVEPIYNKPIYSKDIKLYHKPPSRECGSFNEFFSRTWAGINPSDSWG